MRKLIAAFLLAGALAFAQDADQKNGAILSNYDFELATGAGWDYLSNEAFGAFLASNGMTPLDPRLLWKTGWRLTSGIDRFYLAVSSSRMTNFAFGPYGDTQRTRFVWDATNLSAGWRIVATDGFSWSLGAGVGVSKLLLQAYPTSGGAFASLYASGGSIDLVSSWNWSPEVETLVGIRLTKWTDTSSLWLDVGVQGIWLPLASTWKLFEDPVVTGVPKPFEFALRSTVWIGIR